MTINQSFETFLANIKVDNSEKVSTRYKEITKKLNKTFTNFLYFGTFKITIEKANERK